MKVLLSGLILGNTLAFVITEKKIFFVILWLIIIGSQVVTLWL